MARTDLIVRILVTVAVIIVIAIIAMLVSKNYSIAELLELSFLVLPLENKELSFVRCTLNPSEHEL